MVAPKVKISVVKTAAVDGTFTPIIGAGCSSLEHPGEPRHRLSEDIRTKALAIAASLADDEEKNYLREMIDLDLAATATSRFSMPEPLVKFCVALLRLDRCISMIYRSQRAAATTRELLWKRTEGSRTTFPREVGSWQVPVSPAIEWHELVPPVENAINAAAALVHSSHVEQWRKQGLGPDGICQSLQSFATTLLNSSRTRIQENASVGLTDLVWLGNLFWHCLRFDLPYYPTTAELALQLSLHTSAAMHAAFAAGPSFAKAAEALGDTVLHLTAWFKRYAECSGESKFYKELAAWLKQTFQRHESDRAKRHSRVVPCPLVLTTNYDREVETALAAIGCPYHVVVPVMFDLSKGAVRRHEPLWLTLTVTDPDGGVSAWRYTGATHEAVRSNVDFIDPYKPGGDPVGPIIVKLHGSPLEELPSAEEVTDLPQPLHPIIKDLRFDVECRHRVVASESDYLADMREAVPLWLHSELLRRERNLFFLGHSIGDWNLRLRLTADSSDDDYEVNDRRPITRFAVSKTAGVFDAAFMGRLGIAHVPADLSMIPTILAEVAQSPITG